jgi:hypothetical protein
LIVTAGTGIGDVAISTGDPSRRVPILEPDGTRHLYGPGGFVDVVPRGGIADYTRVGGGIGGIGSVGGTGATESTSSLTIEPLRAAVKKGETTPSFSVMATAADGTRRAVDIPLEVADPNILGPGNGPGQFVAKAVGQTQVRATVGGKTVSADVNVTGDRFGDVKAVPDEHDRDFVLKCEISAPAGEGDLEYRVYVPGQEPPDTWVPAVKEGDSQRVSLTSPAIPTGPRSQYYELVFESRSKSGGEPQKYPYRFRLVSVVESSNPK